VIKLKIKKGDEVIVITGQNKGKKGKVLKILPKENKAIVTGINVVKKHTKPTQNNDGGILQKELPIHISNIAHIDPKTGLATRVKFKILQDGSKMRVSQRSEEIIVMEGK
jgi:large subunit ribosomal protein L24